MNKGLSCKCISLLFLVVSLLFAATPGAGAAAVRNIPGEAVSMTFANVLVRALNENRAADFFKYMDFDALIDRALEDIPNAHALTPKERNEFRTGFAQELPTRFQNLSCELLRYRATPEAQVVLRIQRSSGDFDYVILTLVQIRGELRMVDMYTFTSGDTMSRVLHRGLVRVLAEQDKSLLQKFSQEQRDLIKSTEQSISFSKLFQEGKYAEALAVFNKLPPSIQNTKTHQVQRMTAIIATTPAEFPAAEAHFRQLFPGDPSIAYYTYYAHLIAKQYPEMLADIDQMDKELGPDRFFHQLRAKVYTQMGDDVSAARAAKEGLDTPRKFDTAGRNYFELAVRAKQYADAVAFLAEVERDTRTEMYTIIRWLPVDSKFLSAPEFRTWMNSDTKLPVDSAKTTLKKDDAPDSRPVAEASSSTPVKAAAVPTPEPPKEPEPPYKLGGILFSKTSPAAIINGKTLYVGDKIKEAKVVKIEQSSVTLEVDGKPLELRLK